MKNHAKSRTVTVSCVLVALAAASVAALLLLRRRGEPALPRPRAQPVPGQVAVKPVVREDGVLAPMVAASTSLTCGGGSYVRH